MSRVWGSTRTTSRGECATACGRRRNNVTSMTGGAVCSIKSARTEASIMHRRGTFFSPTQALGLLSHSFFCCAASPCHTHTAQPRGRACADRKPRGRGRRPRGGPASVPGRRLPGHCGILRGERYLLERGMRALWWRWWRWCVGLYTACLRPPSLQCNCLFCAANPARN